jgi:hypothetical protein
MFLADIAFAFLQPHWNNRAVQLTLPAAPGAPSIGASAGNLGSSFAFMPNFGLGYLFPNQGYGVAASGEFLSLTGWNRQTINSTAGSALLNVEGGVNIVAVNLVEGTKLMRFGNLDCLKDCCFADSTVLFSLGTRYTYTHQTFTASLASGNDLANLNATQAFFGFGLTTSGALQCPVSEHFSLYGNARGSFVLGPNNRSSTLSAVTPSNPTASTSAIATQNRTVFLPVGEFEVGLLWGTPLKPTHPPGFGLVGPSAWVRLGLLAQIWGGLGLLPAAGSGQQFTDGSLYLYGFSVTAGINY